MVDSVAEHFQRQADACEAMGSPFTAAVCREAVHLLNRATKTGRAMLDWPRDPSADALALRFSGGLHALALDGADDRLAQCYPPHTDTDKLAASMTGVVSRHDDRLFAALANAPQTNEIARSAVLYPGLVAIAKMTGHPLALHEIGTSAGLNLMMDKYFYRYGAVTAGDKTSTVLLYPKMRGTNAPPEDGPVRIASRQGCDLAPLDINKPEDRLRLRSYIWPDQTDRLARLDAAIEIASKHPFTLVAADAADYVEKSLTARKRGECHVLFHSVMWQYLPEATKTRIERALSDAGNKATVDAPIAWLRMEGLGGIEPYATLQLTLWPGGETFRVARCDFHCRWIEWL